MQKELQNLDSVVSQINDIRQQVASINTLPIASNPMNQGAAENVSFSDVISSTIRSVDNMGKEASAQMHAVDTGQSDDLVGAMIASQKASLSFSAMVQVRNSLMTAYNDVMKMPV
ncbi:flagellar hook-basal body complex protein FliE [Grimontia hollisae]|uniref:Flagellar hook-basal body complex protein FliE n=2 Tax=Grimontia hollisae TaxID=673 RepID=D0I452_GRIHO|nr:flagellar hook-basal body complex protein FliE [Grimontia hollisae]AMG30497.1 flagellar hook-basal body complex protein FliE [Grimontia hollisae]EEY73830.1 flagellar hook-basal body complex protein FliE [Grimontia hollisae CIP 101886]MDF2183776.1 flagellar hook-basal body complex protein FliE [Grimontia hollisae]STO41904.1 flagellar hook-basal body protein FliE [Grimontia hollisae]STO55828.1 flagellar hook-basal body protein FliE [Grimontia hollisae]